MINVTKTFLPELSEYTAYLEKIWANGQVTNEGQFVKELELKLSEFLGVKHAIYVTNGTIALQLAIKALGISGKIITTPFSYCATANSILWEGCTPVFSDINANSLTCEAEEVEKVFTEDVKAIMTTHVYGNAANLEKLEAFAKEKQIPLIFDGAHCFGVEYNHQSIFNYGDISTCSFHATKIFHTIEGGAVFTNNDQLAEKIRLLKSFGHKADDYFVPGINGKTSELHAAMGLVNLNHFEKIKNHRKNCAEQYDQLLANNSTLNLFKWDQSIEKNYSYYPIILKSEELLNELISRLNANKIYPRRYFYPSLNTLEFMPYLPCKVSEDIAKRIICLPLSAELTEIEIQQICEIINQKKD